MYNIGSLLIAIPLALACAVHAAPAQVRVELVSYDDVTIETLVQGTGPAIVVLPSLGRDSYEDYDQVAASLASSGFTVLRPQPRGVGKSVGPMSGQDLYSFARDVAAVIDQQGGRRAVIIGHAFGHFIARMTAVQYPLKVRGVVLAAASAKDTGQRFPDVWTSPGRAGNASLPVEQRLNALRLGFFAAGNDPAIWLKGWHTDVRKMQVEKPVPPSVWWAAGNAPLLELIPEEDPFKPRDRWDELVKEFGSRVTVVTIPKASHALFPEQPEAVAHAIQKWVNALSN
ncbi:MAG: alpha/beta hydrolase [Hyphomicrobiaceae bacterium]|nr:alpha/beta hydrolase [Hyphomicrobiaceae bacterium]